MIASVRFEHYRCLLHVQLALEPLTVLVGPSASGKTAMLEGLQHQLAYEPSDFWRRDESRPLSIEWTYVHGDRTRVEYPFSVMDTLPGQGHSTQQLSLSMEALRGGGSSAKATWLERKGGNLASVFAALPMSTRDVISQELARRVPSLSEVDVARDLEDRSFRLRFRDRWSPDVWFGPDYVSDGVLWLLAFLVLPYQRPLPELLTLDEPERALHPGLVREVLELLRAMTRGESTGGTPVQVVLATHSPDLLEHVRPEEVRLLSREPADGSVRVSPVPATALHWRRECRELLDTL
uniref:AAA family ATPase n=1 Tax=Corallococcus coralloides TaxID=184914 RepID=UPI000FFEA61E|nr:AAA family ATPase [Corallococcus coralloides]